MKKKTLIPILLTLVSLLSTFLNAGAADKNDSAKVFKPTISLHGYGQFRYDVTSVGDETSNAFSISRIILTANGTLTDKLTYFLMVDAGSSTFSRVLHEYWLQYEFFPYLKVRAGQFKQPYCMESLLAPSVVGALNFNESAMYESAVIGDPLLGITMARDAGVMVSGDFLPRSHGYLFGYSLGVFNGTGINIKENNKAKNVIGMFEARPIEGVRIAASFNVGKSRAVSDDPYGNILSGEDYMRTRYSIGAEVKKGPAYLRTEYLWGKNASVGSAGWYAEAWCTVIPKLDLVADIDILNMNTTLSEQERLALPFYTKTTNFSGGLQWWFYGRCRLCAQYIHCHRDAVQDTNGFIAMLQLAF